MISDAADVFQSAFSYAAIIGAPLFCLSIVALAEQIFLLVRRSVTIPLRGRRR